MSMVNELRTNLRRMFVTDRDTLDILIDKIAVMKNPYNGIGEYPVVQKDGNSKMVKISFSMVDKLCFLLEYDLTAYERFKACIDNQLDFKNDLYLSGDDMVKSCCELLSQANSRFGIDSIDNDITIKVVKIIQQMVKSGRIRHHPDRRRDQMTLEKYYKFEHDLANEINRLLLLEPEITFKDSFSASSLTSGQLKAAKMALSNRLSVITGGPGTGKTYLIIRLVRFLLDNSLPIYLCTPTGVSSGKINELLTKEKVGSPTFKPWSRTMHKFIHLIEKKGKPEFPDIAFLDTEVPKFFIIDETSMISLDIIYHFMMRLSSISNCSFIFVGDPKQLPPVGLGEFFKNILAHKSVPHIHLDEIKRQDKSSALLKYLGALSLGDGTGLTRLAKKNEIKKDRVINVKQYLNEDQLKTLIVDNYDPKTTQILCPKNVTVDFINRMAQRVYNDSSIKLMHRDRLFKLNDPVVVFDNNYTKGKNGTFNGDMGTIINIDRNVKERYMDIMIKVTGEKVRYYESEFDQLGLGYSITVHKSQSTEYERIIFIYDINSYGSAKYFANRNLIYTAISRAKCEILILCKEGCDKFINVSAQYESRARLTAINWFFDNDIVFKQSSDIDKREGTLIPDDRKEHLEEFIKRKTGRKSRGKRKDVVKVDDRKITDFFGKSEKIVKKMEEE